MLIDDVKKSLGIDFMMLLMIFVNLKSSCRINNQFYYEGNFENIWQFFIIYLYKGNRKVSYSVEISFQIKYFN